MLRRNSSIEQVLTYATFLAISIALHMLVILGSGEQRAHAPPPNTTTAQDIRR